MVNCDRSSSAAMVILERIANKLPARYGIPVMCLLLNIPVTLIVSMVLLADSDLFIKIIVGLAVFIVLNVIESLIGTWAENTDQMPQEVNNMIIVEYSNQGRFGISSKNVLIEFLLIGVGKMDGKYYLMGTGGNKKVEQIIFSADNIDQIKVYASTKIAGVINWNVLERKYN